MNGILAGTGNSSGFWVPAGGVVPISFNESVSSGDLEAILRSAIISGGQVKFILVGSAGLGIGTFPFSIQGKADLVAYLAKELGIPLP